MPRLTKLEAEIILRDVGADKDCSFWYSYAVIYKNEFARKKLFEYALARKYWGVKNENSIYCKDVERREDWLCNFYLHCQKVAKRKYTTSI